VLDPTLSGFFSVFLLAMMEMVVFWIQDWSRTATSSATQRSAAGCVAKTRSSLYVRYLTFQT
jgi:hypothetical protein